MVEALAADHDEPCLALLARQPGSVEMLLKPIADHLHDLPAISARHIDKAFDPQDIMQIDGAPQPREECIGLSHRAARYDKTLEIVVIMLGLQVMKGGSGREIFLGGGAEAERNFGRHHASPRCDQFYPRPKPRFDFPAKFRQLDRVDKVGLVEDNEIGAGELIRKYLLERVVVNERRV